MNCKQRLCNIVALSLSQLATYNSWVNATLGKYMSSIGFHAHKFVIFDLVPESEMQTGRKIEENLNDFISAENSDLPCERHKCETEEDFFIVIERIKNDLASSGVASYIHIEGHGSREYLYFPSGKFISWSVVFQAFREINILSKNNLFFSSGACESAYAYMAASITKACPVFGLLAPEKEVEAGGVEDGFIAFYKSLIKSGSLNDAFNAFADATDGKKYSLIFSPHIFEKAAFNYLTQHCMGNGRRRRLENVLSQAITETGLPVKKARKALRSELSKPQALALKGFHEKFMMCDLYPENRARFKFDAVEFEQDVRSGKLKIA
jgi:hypothetical protein